MERLLFKHFKKIGTYMCSEVSVPKSFEKKMHRQRVDWLIYEPKSDIFRGFELKLTKQDFHSSAAHTFIYNYNYYLMPYSLFQEIEEEIPDFVGVWVCYDSSMDIQCIKRPKKQKLQCNHDDLLFSMFQSLSREFNKQKIMEFGLKTTKKGKIK